jgi:hypothetical protein
MGGHGFTIDVVEAQIAWEDHATNGEQNIPFADYWKAYANWLKSTYGLPADLTASEVHMFVQALDRAYTEHKKKSDSVLESAFSTPGTRSPSANPST